jgi:hypothetical protein
MEKEDFERLNTLSQKAINDTVTTTELEEFKRLLTIWNDSTEYNMLHCLYSSELRD